MKAFCGLSLTGGREWQLCTSYQLLVSGVIAKINNVDHTDALFTIILMVCQQKTGCLTLISYPLTMERGFLIRTRCPVGSKNPMKWRKLQWQWFLCTTDLGTDLPAERTSSGHCLRQWYSIKIRVAQGGGQDWNIKPVIAGQAALFPELQPPILVARAALKRKICSFKIHQQHVLTLSSQEKAV